MTALVTGASSGIGEEFAKQLAAKGANLILVARSEDALTRLAQSIREEFGVKAEVFVSDLSQELSPYELFDSVQKSALQVDLLVNNAGFGARTRFEEGDPRLPQEMLAVNVHALVALTRLFLPGMLSRGTGGIINVASTAAFQPMPFLSLYAATKAFVLSFTEGLWGEYEKIGVRIFCLCPGNTRTQFHEKAKIKPRQIFLAAASEDVVRYGLKIFCRTDRPTAVYGAINKILAQGYRLAPRKLVLKIVKLLYRGHLN